jgi:Temperature dependent protein affecting M2 dsRNA replication
LTKAEGWFAHIDVANSFKDACQLWKALFKGAEKAADQALLRDNKKAAWSEAEKWMGERVVKNHA